MANSYLYRTNGTPTNAYKGTVSHWIKRSGIGASTEYGSFGAWANGVSSTRSHCNFYDDTIYFYSQQHSTVLQTNRKFRDTNGFYHVVIAWDTTQSTASDRVKIYVNGVQETSFSTANYPAQNSVLEFNTSGRRFAVGCLGSGTGSAYAFWNGYISHAAFVDGLQLTPTSFGETDSTSGIWKFKSPSGITWGNNGFHLKFENSGALGTDSSGNSNTFTVSGNLKQALDTPSNVHCTMNPLDNYYPASTFSNGNNTIVTSSGNYNPTFGTLAVSSGKYYWEVKVDTTSTEDMIGIRGEQTRSNYDFNGTYDFFYNSKARFYDGSSGSQYGSYGATFTTGDIIGVALDLDSATNTIQFYKNGSAQGSKNITSVSSTPIGVYNIALGDYTSGASATFSVNFGNGFFGTTAITSAGSNGNGSLFEYDCPSGYYALNTKNINTYG